MNSLTPFRLNALVAALFCLLTLSALSQPVITSFTTNGALVCSQLAPGSVATVEWASSLGSEPNWQDLQSGTVAQDGTFQVTVPTSQAPAPRFYRLRGTGWPANMALIPAGTFTMGNTLTGEGRSDELPLHSVYISAFHMDKYEVTKGLWDEVYNWATNHGYSFTHPAEGKANNHPAHSMYWYDAVKWCNARSEKDAKAPAFYSDALLSVPYRSGQVEPYVDWNSGYRLPTEAEWERAARGGSSGRRFPWTTPATIDHTLANYCSMKFQVYDLAPWTDLYHPTFIDVYQPYTSPVGYFAPNDYGLFDMAGNVSEFCWDWFGSYSSATQTDPRGPSTGSFRISRGGNWHASPLYCRVASRGYGPLRIEDGVGFRTVLPVSQ